jgi:hypothetical protein
MNQVKVIERPPVFTATKFEPEKKERIGTEAREIKYRHSYGDVYIVFTSLNEGAQLEAGSGDWIIQNEYGAIVDAISEEKFLLKYDSRIG